MHIAIVNSMNYYIIISFDFIYISYRLLLDIDISTYLLTMSGMKKLDMLHLFGIYSYRYR